MDRTATDLASTVQMVIDNDQGTYHLVRALTDEILNDNGRYSDDPDLLGIEYDQLIGQAIREWVVGTGVKKDSITGLIVTDLLGKVAWSEIGKDLHDEVVKAKSESLPELEIHMFAGQE